MAKMVATSSKAYKTNPPNTDYVYGSFSDEDIVDIIQSADPSLLRELSRFFFRMNGKYRRIISYYSNLLLYDYVLTPHYGDKADKQFVYNKTKKGLAFLDNLNLPRTFSQITSKILVQGVYYGVFQHIGDRYIFQELPVNYCRTRFKNEYGIDIVEFDLRYFDSILDKDERYYALSCFPMEIQVGYIQAQNKADKWIELPAQIATAFYFYEIVPFFISSALNLARAERIEEREMQRAEEELEKILINKIPLDKNDEPVLSMEQLEVYHNGIGNMLKDHKYIDVLTTFGDTDLAQVQESDSTAQRNTIQKFSDAAYSAAGVSSSIFNSAGNTALKYSIEKDVALMHSLATKYETWLTFIVNHIYGNSKISFSVDILPISIHTRKDMQDAYLRGAQYGYSKIYAGVAEGIRQSDMMSLIHFENDILNLHNTMIPLQSSYTQNSAQNSGQNGKANDTNNENKGHVLDETQRSDKTIVNRNSL